MGPNSASRRGGVVGCCAVDGDHGIRLAGLRREGVESALKVVAAAAGDDDGGDSRIHRSQPKLGRCAVQRVERGAYSRRAGQSAGALAQLAALALGEAAPDAEALVVRECVLEALGPHFARRADLLRVAGRAALLGEERLGVGLRAQGVGLPGERVVVVDTRCRTPGTPSLTGSTNQSSGTPERYSGTPYRSPTLVAAIARTQRVMSNYTGVVRLGQVANRKASTASREFATRRCRQQSRHARAFYPVPGRSGRRLPCFPGAAHHVVEACAASASRGRGRRARRRRRCAPGRPAGAAPPLG